MTTLLVPFLQDSPRSIPESQEAAVKMLESKRPFTRESKPFLTKQPLTEPGRETILKHHDRGCLENASVPGAPRPSQDQPK